MEVNYGLLALIPPAVAIILCFATKQVLVSLYAGLFAGALIVSNWNPITGITYSLQVMIDQITDAENASLILFTMFMGVGIAFIWRLGGSLALAEAAKRRFRKRRSVCLGTWGLGMVTSINDCLVAAVDGNVFRDICKDYRISSEKFSYVLDSTAAPAAALFISDWIAYQIGMIGQGLNDAGISGVEPVSAYIQGLPFNLFSILTLLFVGILMYTGKDYGPMLKAEVRCMTTGEFTRPGANPMLDVGSDLGEPKKNKPMIRSFVLPIVLAIATIFAGIFWTGREAAPQGIMAILETCDARSALLWGAFVMAMTGLAIALISRIMTFEETMNTMLDGFKLMMLTACILVMAWSLASITQQMGLAQFVVNLISSVNFPIGLLPLLVMGISMLIAFATGTSWGTMAIMTPLAITMTYTLTQDLGMTLAMSGAVLSGAIFGDNTSPVSDTTVMASIFSGADHIDHVATQLPYALTVGIVCGFLFTLYGFTHLSPVILILLGIAILVVLQQVLHKIFIKRYNLDENYAHSMIKDIQ